MYCSNCGIQLFPEANFCWKCGQSQQLNTSGATSTRASGLARVRLTRSQNATLWNVGGGLFSYGEWDGEGSCEFSIEMTEINSGKVTQKYLGKAQLYVFKVEATIDRDGGTPARYSLDPDEGSWKAIKSALLRFVSDLEAAGWNALPLVEGPGSLSIFVSGSWGPEGPSSRTISETVVLREVMISPKV